jgi:hypothetical protein
MPFRAIRRGRASGVAIPSADIDLSFLQFPSCDEEVLQVILGDGFHRSLGA